MRTRLGLVVFALVLAGPLGAQDQTPAPPDPKGPGGFGAGNADPNEPHLKVYDRSRNGYILRAPKEFVEDKVEGRVDIKISRKDPDCNFNVVVVSAQGMPGITRQVLIQVRNEVRKQYAEFKPIALKVEKFQGKVAGWYEIEGVVKGVPVKVRQRQYFIIHKTKALILTLTSEPKAWTKSLPLFKALLWDMRFVD